MTILLAHAFSAFLHVEYGLLCIKPEFLIIFTRLGTTKFGKANVDTIKMHIDIHKPTFPFDY